MENILAMVPAFVNTAKPFALIGVANHQSTWQLGWKGRAYPATKAA